MKTFQRIIKNTVSEYTVYRLNFILWRFRMLLRLLILFFLWQAIYGSQNFIFGYGKSQMLTYILLSQIVTTFIFSTKTQELGDLIHQGNLSNHLIKPLNIFHFLLARDVADKALNILFSIIEIALIIVIFRPPIMLTSDISTLLLFFIAVIMGIGMYFMVSIVLSLMSFWTQESWAHRFLFFVISDFLAGGLFPLDILPQPVFRILSLLPFPYMLYFPLKVYLGNQTSGEIIQGFIISLIWVGIFYAGFKILWQKGLKLYTAEGR